MVAHEFLANLDKFHFVDSTGLDDFADKCSYLLSFIMVMLCFTIVTLKSYVFEPVSCYTATTLSGSNLITYINAFCWANGTVGGDVETRRLEESDYWRELENNKLNYYQWASLVLAIQAILCYLPRLVWEGITFNRVGTNLDFLIETAQGASKESGTARQSRVRFLSNAMDTLLFARRSFNQDVHLSRGRALMQELLPRKRLGRALCIYYFIIKLAYLGNSVFQLVIMQYFLGMPGSHRLFGLQVLIDMWNGRHWKETLIFPRVGWCRVPIKLVGDQVPTLIAQCTLPVNMLNEKVYVFLWFWFVGVGTLEAISIGIWFMRLAVRRRRVQSLVHYMKIADNYDDGMREILKRFESVSLRPDGAFLLHMFRLNAGDIITQEILQHLVKRYMDHERLVATAKVGRVFPAVVNNPSPISAIDPEKVENDCNIKMRLV